MWITMIVTVGAARYWCQAKVYETGSQFGINDGTISKMCVRANDNRGIELYNYDRGLDFDNLQQIAFDAILAELMTASGEQAFANGSGHSEY